MKKVENKKFIIKNKKFWAKFREPQTGGLLLVEISKHPVINHSNAIAAKMVAQARKLRIAWLIDQEIDRRLMASYSVNSTFISTPKIGSLRRLLFLLEAGFYYLFFVLWQNKTLTFKYNNLLYGDCIYDGYLAHYKMATFHRWDPRIIMIIYRLLLNNKKDEIILSQNPIKAVLVSHYFGLRLGPLTRLALQKKIPVYWKGGGHEIFELAVFKQISKIHNYPLKPTNKKIDLLIKKSRKKIEADFRDFISHLDNPYFGVFTVGYNNSLFSNINKITFLKKMHFRDNKPVVFVMLHAFNDYPHSHFKKMLFKDYYDWFIKTLNYAKRDSSKNWIFKEHPANKYYQTKDFDFKKVMANLPKHIRFVTCKSWVNATTVLSVADLIVTCLGSAGIEMPALRGIPSLIAGDTYFDGLGFTIEPKSQREYFSILKNLPLKRLTKDKQLRAKCVYLMIKKYSALPFTAGPGITFQESRHSWQLAKTYSQRILSCYRKKSKLIYKQFRNYTDEIKKPTFSHLIQLPSNNFK